MEPLGNGEAVLDGGAYVLREVADLGFVAPEDGAGIENEFLVGEAGVVVEKALDERGFAGAVAARPGRRSNRFSRFALPATSAALMMTSAAGPPATTAETIPVAPIPPSFTAPVVT